jgi:hypothetical protein
LTSSLLNAYLQMLPGMHMLEDLYGLTLVLLDW